MTFFKFLLALKALKPILVTSGGMLIDNRLQLRQKSSDNDYIIMMILLMIIMMMIMIIPGISVMNFGIMTDCRLLQSANVSVPVMIKMIMMLTMINMMMILTMITMIITIMIPSLTILSGSTIDCKLRHCANALSGNSVNNVDSNT
jgi:hypothetical protein